MPTKLWRGALGIAFGAGLILAATVDGNATFSTWDQMACVIFGLPLTGYGVFDLVRC